MTNTPGQGSGHQDDGWVSLNKDAPVQPAPYAPTEFSPTYQAPPTYQAQPTYQDPSSDPYLAGYGANPPLPPVAAPGSDGYYGAVSPNPYGQYPPTPGYPQYPAPVQYGPYGAGPYGYGQPMSQTNGKSTAALICGIASLVSVFLFSCFSIPISGPTGIVALVMGVKARREIDDSAGAQSGSGNALAGLITGGIGLALSVICTVLLIAIIFGTY